MKKILSLCAALAGAGLSVAAVPAKSGLRTGDDKALYALGYQMVIRQGLLSSMGLNSRETAVVLSGMKDAALGEKPRVDIAKHFSEALRIQSKKLAERAEPRKVADRAFIKKMAAKPGAKMIGMYKLPSSSSQEALAAIPKFVYIPVREGHGPKPRPQDRVGIFYKTALSGGETAERRYWNGKMLTTPLSAMMPCLQAGIPEMRAGGEADFVCPSSLAYGDRGHGKVPGGAAVDISVKLIRVLPAAAAKPSPQEVKKRKAEEQRWLEDHPAFARLRQMQKQIQRHPELASSPQYKALLQEVRVEIQSAAPQQERPQ